MAWTYDDAIEYLESHVNFEQQSPTKEGAPSLDRMRALCAAMADPQHAAPVIHVTGTNGKGSTTRIITSLLAAHGLNVGTYTSPDIERVNERLSRNGEMISDDDFAEQLLAIAELEAITGVRPTRFDILTLAALRWFADLAVDVVVLEVGLGGRWDSTNVADATVAVVTNVGLDHVDIIGPRREDIAREKSGIVKPGSTLVIGETDDDIVAIFEAARPARTWRRGREFDVDDNTVAVGGRAIDVHTPTSTYDDVFLALHGAHQGENAALAIAAVEAFFERPTPDDVVREALATVEVPGRFEVLGRHPLLVIDGAHNAHGAVAAARTFEDFRVEGDRILVVGTNRPHDPFELLEALDARGASLVIGTNADFPRAVPATDMAAAAESLGIRAIAVPGVKAAVAEARRIAAPEDAILVTGSLYVVGEARRVLAAN